MRDFFDNLGWFLCGAMLALGIIGWIWLLC